MATATSPVHAGDVTIDGSRRFQKIEGFGSCLYLNATHPYDQAWFQDLYARDLGASIVRMELTPRVLGPIDKPVTLGPDIEQNIRRFDFSEAGGPATPQMVVAAHAKALDRMLLIGSLWTPPHWMKTGARLLYNDTNSAGGHLTSTPANLEQFGRYVAAYVKGFEQKYGVPFYAVSIQNELLFDEPYNSCVYTPQEYHDAVRAVAEEFKRDGIKTKIEGPESVGPDDAWLSEQQMKFIHAVQDDPKTADCLSFFSIHGYGGNGVDVISDGKGLRDYWSAIKGYGKESWMTESSGEYPDWLHSDGKGGQDGALSVGKHLFEGLVYGNYNAVVYWQTADGGKASKTTLTNSDLNATPPPDRGAKYCAAKQFFRYIRPGAVRISASPEAPLLGVAAFRHDGSRTLTVVMVNMAETPQTVRLMLRNVPPARQFRVWRTSATDRFAPQPPVPVRAGTASVTLPAQSVVTLYGAALPAGRAVRAARPAQRGRR